MERTTQLLRGVLDMCLLALIEQQECYGYEIVRRLEQRGLGLVAEGSIYPALSRLVATGCIEGDWKPSPDGPRRKYYRLLPAGHAQLAAWRDEWDAFQSAIDAVVAPATAAGSTERAYDPA